MADSTYLSRRDVKMKYNRRVFNDNSTFARFHDTVRVSLDPRVTRFTGLGNKNV